MAVSRTPKADVRRRLRREVNFGCPFCRSPFLTWHHFDPPWEPQHVHNEPGMIALCSECHRFADGGHYTKEQLRQLKVNPPTSPPKGRLPWSSSSALVTFGGNAFLLPTNRAFSLRVARTEVFGLRVAENSYLTVNATIWDTDGDVFCNIEENDIIAHMDTLGDLECKVQAKTISVSSQKCTAQLSLSFDRSEPAPLLEGLSKARRRSRAYPTRELHDMVSRTLEQCVQGLTDSDGLVPSIDVKLNIQGPGFGIGTGRKGIRLDTQGLGYENAVLTGKNFIDSFICFEYDDEEIVFIGNVGTQGATIKIAKVG